MSISAQGTLYSYRAFTSTPASEQEEQDYTPVYVYVTSKDIHSFNLLSTNRTVLYPGFLLIIN